jgi:ABC-type transport system involved in multi-copper enzyme maturation permease subunit
LIESNLSGALVVMRKEVMEHIRTKRLLIMAILYLVALLIGLWIGIVLLPRVALGLPTSDKVTFVLGFYFGLFPIINGTAFTSALGLVMSADAICGEWKNRTLFLLLSKPVSRSAVLAGKIAAAFASVLGVFALVFAIGFLVVLVAVGAPGWSATGRILGGFGIVALSILPFVGLGILTSTIYRSTVASFLVAFAAWLLILPILGSVGYIIRLMQRDFTGNLATDGLVKFFNHLNPRWLMDQGSYQMLGGRRFELFGPIGENVDVPLALLAIAAHTIVYLGLSFWIVNRRDYS